MPETVEYLTSGRLAGPLPRTLRLALRYRADDPYAVNLCFPGPALLGEGLVVEDGGPAADGLHWTVGRELLEEGTRRAAGLGDLRIRPGADDTVRLEFHAADGYAAFHLDHADLRGFLDASYRLVPPGTEDERCAWPATAEEFANRLF
ncbi:SsgA family sporulation/cell division regulator [Kitasatospora sp. NBC_01287]|uniref:SsgA family sporulation/cell division regulator n=1 Tax=Kitasatospora sp. NBC_01287 TaxID=2903573 RepID=UPI00225A4C65|nr:SsgA family sporulation/cell division regulator [Kitasatospora sp. NBC_01287]MCX4751662.1 SsgA family sporulation/cell division regulator [Kitasatospora sp. NBC_01287]